MPEPSNLFDVWVVQNHAVYRDVPFVVVTDWIQEGRLLEEDKLRPAGTEAWLPLTDYPQFLPYLPQPEPHRAEDRAEALESVEVEVPARNSREEVDEDVDMIPLIDISLVLLVFFMMTATVSTGASLIDTPTAQYKLYNGEPDNYWVGMKKGPDGIEYSMGKGEGGAGTKYPGREEVAQALAAALDQEPKKVRVRIRADRRLPIEEIEEMTARLEDVRRSTQKVLEILGEVSEKQP